MEQEILEIKALIDELRATDAEFRVFGADCHRYRIGPKLSEIEIQDFERKHDIILPDDYRLYLQLVGNGNGVPGRERTAPWQQAGAGPSYGVYPLEETVRGKRVNQPFPFEEEVTIPYEPPYDEWEEDIPGALEICTMGCSSHTHLIVKGPKYGTVWEGAEYDHFTPTNFSFSQWIRSWAEKELRVFVYKPLVERIKIGMSKDEVIAATGEGWTERIVAE